MSVATTSQALVLRRSAEIEGEPACQEWLVYVREPSGIEVMLDVSRTEDLRTRDEALRPFAAFRGAYAVPVED